MHFWCCLLPCCLQSLGTAAEGNGCVSSVGFVDHSSRTRLCSPQSSLLRLGHGIRVREVPMSSSDAIVMRSQSQGKLCFVSKK